MKSKFLIIFLSFLFISKLNAESLNIESLEISIDKKTKITVFKKDVVAKDSRNNILKTNYAEYNKDLEIFESKGETTIITSEGYVINGTDIVFDNKKNLIFSEKPTLIKDPEKNDIFLENFNYLTSEKFFRSFGNIEVKDLKKNSYKFSQIYIDEKKREIVGTDIKAFLNQDDLKIENNNKPRVFANTIKIDKNESQFTKSIFTICDYRKGDKCPPWSIQAGKMRHNKIQKTIYYDNAVIKIYDVPILYLPKLSHPDPTVDRRSGFLPPTLLNSKNLGTGIKVPYYFAINRDKDFTLNTSLFDSERPLMLGEYRQAFKTSNLILDLGYTEGFKKSEKAKKVGDRSHLFAKFVKNFESKEDAETNFKLSLQNTSDDKYLKLYKIKSNLTSYETNTLENSINFTHNDDDIFFGLNASIYETLQEDYNDKYEFILPEITLDKNLFRNKFGVADLTSNLKVHNYDTNKHTKFLVNDVDWKYSNLYFDSGLKSNILGKLKNINYEAKNTEFKTDTTNEFFGALGYLAEINLFKKTIDNSEHFLTPKILFRAAPDFMRKETGSLKLNHLNIFSLDRLNSNNNFEGGLSTTIGFDYDFRNERENKQINFTVGQIINEKEKKNMPSSSSLDEKLSDVVGNLNYQLNENTKINYNFALDQNYNDLNYNEFGAEINTNIIKFDLSYLQEKRHIGDQEYIKAKFDLARTKNGIFSAGTKRNLVTDSAEYYDLSYEYLNDCLRAGIVYRREFYEDSELEPENSLMFRITISPLGNINTPSFNR